MTGQNLRINGGVHRLKPLRKLVGPGARPGLSRVRARRAQQTVERAASGAGSVIVGPWHSEVGFEILYWIPMLRWAQSRFGLGAERVIAVSRGGAGPWYRDLAARYVDLLDLIPTSELARLGELRANRLGGQKQFGELREDGELLDKVRASTGEPEAAVLHPAAMFGLFRWYWSNARPISLVTDHTVNSPLPAPEGDAPWLKRFPERYVAVKAYHSNSFPDSDRNRAFLGRLLDRLRLDVEIVLLDSDLGIDEHAYFGGRGDGVTNARALMSARDNLEVQTRIIAGADALITTYGGFSYLGPHLGVPTLSFFSEQSFNHEHLDVMRFVARDLAAQGAGASFEVLNTSEFEARAALARSISGAAA